MHVKTDKPPSPRMKRTTGRRQRKLQGPDIRPPSPDIQLLRNPRTSGPPQPGYPAPTPKDTRRLTPSARTPGPSPGRPASHEAPDIRPQPGNPASSNQGP